jgi:hypothetical protein
LELGDEDLPMEGEVLVPYHEEIGAEFAQVVGKLDRIPIANGRKAVKAKPVGNGAEEGVIFREYDS